MKEGKVIVFEGISSCGKSTVKNMVGNYLENRGIKVHSTEWNTDCAVGKIIAESKRQRLFTPRLWSMSHATEFLKRYLEIISPMISENGIVLADRYYYTAYARDVVRGELLEDVKLRYTFARKPDLVIYFDVEPNVALKRRKERRNELSYYGSGMDMSFCNRYEDNWIIYQTKLKQQYEKVLDMDITVVIDANKQLRDVYENVISIIEKNVQMER